MGAPPSTSQPPHSPCHRHPSILTHTHSLPHTYIHRHTAHSQMPLTDMCTLTHTRSDRHTPLSQTHPQTDVFIYRLPNTPSHTHTQAHTHACPTLACTHARTGSLSPVWDAHLKLTSSTASSGVFRCTLRSRPFLVWIPPSRLAVPRTPVTHLSPACPRAPTAPICAEIWSRALRGEPRAGCSLQAGGRTRRPLAHRPGRSPLFLAV